MRSEIQRIGEYAGVYAKLIILGYALRVCDVYGWSQLQRAGHADRGTVKGLEWPNTL